MSHMGNLQKGEAKNVNRYDWRPLRGDGSTLLGRPFFGDPELDRQLAGHQAFWCLEGGRRLLAIPWEPDQPFPLPELFCLAEVGEALGRTCVIWKT